MRKSDIGFDELQAQVADLDQQIADWYERIAEIKSERAALARKVSNWQEVAEGATRRKANRIARRWGVTVAHNILQIGFDEFNAAWSDGLNGYVITFNDGRVAHAQVTVETDRLHADYGREYLERYTDYDDELSDDQSGLVDSFIKRINRGEAQGAHNF
jgi:hypothetical protein